MIKDFDYENYSWQDVFDATERLHAVIFEMPNQPLRHVLPVAIKDVLLEVLLDMPKYWDELEFKHEITLLKCAYDQLKKEGVIGYKQS